MQMHPLANGNENTYKRCKLSFQEWDKTVKREEQQTENDFLEQFHKDVFDFVDEGLTLKDLKAARDQANTKVRERKNKNFVWNLFEDKDKTLKLELDYKGKEKAYLDANTKREQRIQYASIEKFAENPMAYPNDYKYQYDCLVTKTGLLWSPTESQDFIQNIGKKARETRIKNIEETRDSKFRDLDICAFSNRDNVLPDYRELIEGLDINNNQKLGFYLKEGTDKKTWLLGRIDKAIKAREEENKAFLSKKTLEPEISKKKPIQGGNDAPPPFGG